MNALIYIRYADTVERMLRALRSGHQLLNFIRCHAAPVVFDDNAQDLLCPNRLDPDAALSRQILRKSVDNCVLDDRLQNKSRDVQRNSVRGKIAFDGEIIAAAVTHDRQVIVDIVQFILERDQGVLLMDDVAQQRIERIDERHDIVRVLQFCHPRDVVEYVGHKMRIDLRLQKGKFAQALFPFVQCDLLHELLQAVDHAVERSADLTDLVMAFDLIARGKITVGDHLDLLLQNGDFRNGLGNQQHGKRTGNGDDHGHPDPCRPCAVTDVRNIMIGRYRQREGPADVFREEGVFGILSAQSVNVDPFSGIGKDQRPAFVYDLKKAAVRHIIREHLLNDAIVKIDDNIADELIEAVDDPPHTGQHIIAGYCGLGSLQMQRLHHDHAVFQRILIQQRDPVIQILLVFHDMGIVENAVPVGDHGDPRNVVLMTVQRRDIVHDQSAVFQISLVPLPVSHQDLRVQRTDRVNDVFLVRRNKRRHIGGVC